MSPIGLDKKIPLQTVAETRVFCAAVDRLLSREEHEAVILGIASDPAGGDLIPGTGGLREHRIALPGRGKRGGARVITLWLGGAHPVYALFLFAKNERADLSPDQKRMLMRLVQEIKERAARTKR
jgi:hypothetical protein